MGHGHPPSDSPPALGNGPGFVKVEGGGSVFSRGFGPGSAHPFPGGGAIFPGATPRSGQDLHPTMHGQGNRTLPCPTAIGPPLNHYDRGRTIPMKLGIFMTSVALTLGTIEYVSATDGPNRSLILGTYRAATHLVATQVIPYACDRLPQLGGPCRAPAHRDRLHGFYPWVSRSEPMPPFPFTQTRDSETITQKPNLP